MKEEQKNRKALPSGGYICFERRTKNASAKKRENRWNARLGKS
jgi:hypothetical protein